MHDGVLAGGYSANQQPPKVNNTIANSFKANIVSDVSISLPSKEGEPTWEAAYLLPTQGCWTEVEFFKFHTNRMAELVDGSLEILPMPLPGHNPLRKFSRALR